ncbi:MAG: hypothetical protein K0U52_00960, partial [Gammaproteobacteria bacterium]|nr:hypothetical protein [Gammaproteobacteria bacterium]
NGKEMHEDALFEHVFRDKQGHEHKSNVSKCGEWARIGAEARQKSLPSERHQKEANQILKHALTQVKEELTQNNDTASSDEATILSPAASPTILAR